MGASNFAKSNTSKVFAVLMDREEKYSKCSECEEKYWEWEGNYVEEGDTDCPDCDCKDCIEHGTEYRSAERYEYEDFKEYLRETAQEEEKELKTIWYKEESGSDNDRNYCATNLFSYSISKMFGDIEIEVRIIGQIVSAYYEGASLDFVVEFNGEEYTNDESDFEWLFEYQSEMNKGLQVLQNKNAIKWAEKTKTELIELIEEVFTKVSEPLNVVASFSNGETIYQKA